MPGPCRRGGPQVRLDGALNPIRRELCSPVAFRVQAADDDSDGVRLPGHPARLERCELASKWSEAGAQRDATADHGYPALVAEVALAEIAVEGEDPARRRDRVHSYGAKRQTA